ncbi:hypothetical protein GCM10029992_37520 [Glycomyces albus]
MNDDNMHRIELSEATLARLRTIAAAQGDGCTEETVISRLCEAYERAALAASPRLGRPWPTLLTRLDDYRAPAWSDLDRSLSVTCHLSYRQGLITDFQGVSVTACAHAMDCVRLVSATGARRFEIVSVDRFEQWLAERAEQGAEAERQRAGEGVEVATGTEHCRCLAGTPVFDRAFHPAHPEDIVYLVGAELRRYESLFFRLGFEPWPVEEMDGVDTVKELRWMHHGVEDLCTCAEPCRSIEECPVAGRDLTFECDRGCADGCDWVLYPLYGRAWLQVHGTDIDLGPLEADHTHELTARYLPELRL